MNQLRVREEVINAIQKYSLPGIKRAPAPESEHSRGYREGGRDMDAVLKHAGLLYFSLGVAVGLLKG